MLVSHPHRLPDPHQAALVDCDYQGQFHQAVSDAARTTTLLDHPKAKREPEPSRALHVDPRGLARSPGGRVDGRRDDQLAGRAFARGEGQDRDILSRLARGANKGSQRLPTSPDGLRPYATFALVNGSPPDFPEPARTPYPCLGVK